MLITIQTLEKPLLTQLPNQQPNQPLIQKHTQLPKLLRNTDDYSVKYIYK